MWITYYTADFVNGEELLEVIFHPTKTSTLEGPQLKTISQISCSKTKTDKPATLKSMKVRETRCRKHEEYSGFTQGGWSGLW